MLSSAAKLNFKVQRSLFYVPTVFAHVHCNGAIGYNYLLTT